MKHSEQINEGFLSLFQQPVPVLAMVHLRALPGTPAYRGNFPEILEKAVAEAKTYISGGVDGLIVENMHDTPYLNRNPGPEITAAMSVACREIRNACDLPCGVQVLAGANREALAIAQASGLDFIRAEGFVFGHVADEGWMDAGAGKLLRYRKMIGADHIKVLCDIKKKHSAHAVTADVGIADTAQAAAFYRSDGVILTGSATGLPAKPADLKKVKVAVNIPVLVGSGINLENIGEYMPVCDAMIIGSTFKKDGFWANDIDENRVYRLMEKIIALRSS